MKDFTTTTYLIINRNDEVYCSIDFEGEYFSESIFNKDVVKFNSIEKAKEKLNKLNSMEKFKDKQFQIIEYSCSIKEIEI